MCRAAVALLTAMPWAASQRAAKAPSKRSMAGPWVSQSELRVSTTASMSAWEMLWRP